MKTVFKFPLALTGKQTLMLDPNGEILTVQVQHQHICLWVLWVLVDTEEKPMPRHFAVYGTGEPIPDELTGFLDYLGTVQQGEFVWHIFEKIGGPF